MTRIGLVLGAGGVTGEAFHRGVLAALGDVTGFDPRSAAIIVGTSAGSIVGASLRCANAVAADRELPAPPDETLPRRVDLRALGAALRRPWSARVGVLATSVLPAGTRSTEVFAEPLRRRCGATWPEDGLYVCAVRRRDGQRVVFGSPGAPTTDVATAVAASCAIPGYFRPVTIDDEAYVDGGVHSPTNADVLAGHRLDLVVVSSPMSVAPNATRAKIDLSARILWHGYVVAERRALQRHGTLVLTIEPGGATLRALGLNTLDASRVDRIEDLARETTTALLARPDKAPVVALLAGGGDRRRSSA